MKKAIIFLLLGIFYSSTVSAQDLVVFETIGTSKYAQTFYNAGFLQSSTAKDDFYSFDGNSAGFSIGFTSGLILSGVDANGAVHTSFNTYNPDDYYFPGVLNENGLPIAENEEYFNRIWSITSEEISLVEQLFNDNQISLDGLPNDIKEWPAKGNPYFGYDITEDLAPFYDHDNDNIYDPLNGDLPIPIEENENFIPTKFTFCVYHTMNEVALQISQIKYTLDCADNDLQNSIFNRLKIENKSVLDLVEFKLGIYKDFDLGCYEDDFVGSHQGTNSAYAYNREGADISGCVNGSVSMPDNMSAIQSLIFLSHSLHSCVPEYRFAGTIPFPSLPIEYHRVLNGSFADGTPMTYGESGFNPASTDVTKFIFSELPNDPAGWSMYDSALYDYQDTRLIPSIDLENLNSGSSRVVDLVDAVLPYEALDYSIFDTYEERVANIINLHDMSVNQEIDCYSFSHCVEDCVWPGDLNGNGRVEADDVVYLASMLGDDTSNAKRRSRITSEWFGFESESWQGESADIDYKYGDVNGNGELNSFDLSLLVDNFKLQNSVYQKQADEFATFDPEGIGVALESDQISATGGIVDASASGNINLGDEFFNFSESIVAISFDVLIDTNLVFFSPFFNNNGVTNIFDEKMHYYEEENDPYAQDNPNPKMSNRESYVLYNLNEPITQGGFLNDRFGISAHTFGKTGNKNGQEYTKIEIANVFALDADGNKIDVGVRFSDSVLITDLIYDPTSSVEDNESIQVNVFPNPVTDRLFVRLNVAEKGILKVTNLEGKLISSQSFDVQNFEIDTRDWNKGTYIINFTSNNKSETRKIVKI